MVNFKEYHAVSGAQHQTNFNSLKSQGYRMISLSVYGDPSNPMYAAVWVQRAGPPWHGVHNVDLNGFQSFANQMNAQGYAPVLISATGGAGNAVYAGTFEQGIPRGWISRILIPGSSTFMILNDIARGAGLKQILRSVAIYGDSSQRFYAAVWHPNPGYVKWHVHPADSGADYQTTFNAETQLPGHGLSGYRAAYVAVSGADPGDIAVRWGSIAYCSIFKDDFVGDWVGRHGMAQQEYELELAQQQDGGRYPICVQGGGLPGFPIYAAIFARQDIPSAREWTVTGAPVPTLASVDKVVKDFMQANAVRTAQVAIGKNGVTKFSRAYTWAEPGYHITQPSDRFLLASCSKIFLVAAVQSLYDTNKLTPTQKAYKIVKKPQWGKPKDTRSDDITVQQLVDHKGGYDDTSTGSNWDPTYNMRAIALALGKNQAVDKLDMAQYMYTQYTLDYTPGTGGLYSNFGYLLLGAIVEQVTGMTYFDYVNATLLQPAGITDVKVFPTLASHRSNDEAIAEDQGLGQSAIDLQSQLLVPAVYGGNGEINEVGDPQDGMGASAEALIQFIHLHAVNGPMGPRAAGWGRSGSTHGTTTYAESRTDGIDAGYVLNTRDFPPPYPSLDVLKNFWDSITQILDNTKL